jgi:hypothetical protein
METSLELLAAGHILKMVLQQTTQFGSTEKYNS